MKPFEAKADENTCNECATYDRCVELEKMGGGVPHNSSRACKYFDRENQPPRKYFHFPVVRFALAETLVALDRTEGVREISIGMCDGELTVNFRVLEEWERDTRGVSCVPYELNKNKEE
jgi:hypothetical protein